MITEKIINLIRKDKLVEARDLTETVLYSKLSDILSEMYENNAPTLFGEAKKKAPVTDKDDDGEGMDPVGKGDDDIDNDGDSDSSDSYLKNRRKAIKKAIKKDDDVEEAKTVYGMSPGSYATQSPESKSQARQKHYRDKESKERENERERKKKERESARRDAERGRDT